VLWQSSVTSTTGLFNGAAGHVYGFHVLSHDLAGNSEATKTAAESITEVVSTPFCASNATPEFSAVRGGFRFDNGTKRFTQRLTIANDQTSKSFTGPFALVLDNLSSNAVLYNSASTTACAFPAGSPIVILNTGQLWPPGKSIAVDLEFSNPTRAGISYTPRILAGTGN
jgi:hypothetical protein